VLQGRPTSKLIDLHFFACAPRSYMARAGTSPSSVSRIYTKAALIPHLDLGTVVGTRGSSRIPRRGTRSVGASFEYCAEPANDDRNWVCLGPGSPSRRKKELSRWATNSLNAAPGCGHGRFSCMRSQTTSVDVESDSSSLV
jgi:hypothetical protein